MSPRYKMYQKFSKVSLLHTNSQKSALATNSQKSARYKCSNVTTLHNIWEILKSQLATNSQKVRSLEKVKSQLATRVAKIHSMPYLCRSFSAKQPLIVGLFCGKRPTKIRHAMGLCHPVRRIPHQILTDLTFETWGRIQKFPTRCGFFP